VVRRWQQLAMSVPFETWSSNVREQKRLASVAEKIVRRCLFPPLALGRSMLLLVPCPPWRTCARA